MAAVTSPVAAPMTGPSQPFHGGRDVELEGGEADRGIGDQGEPRKTVAWTP